MLAKMRVVMPRSSRSRLLLLPLVVGLLVAPALLTTSTPPLADQILLVGTACKNVDVPVRKLQTPHPAPTCVNCRAPLLNAPLARADRPAPAPHSADAPPAA
jgi:hypothetical protein